MKIFNILKLLTLMLSLVITSCVDLDGAEFNREETRTFFQTEEDVKSGIVTVYDCLAKGANTDDASGDLGGAVYDVAKIYFEEGTHTCHGGAKGLGRNDFTSSNKNIERMYLTAYFGISKANLVLEKMETIAMSDESRNHYRAETRFLRALFYFNLVQYYGGVPIITKHYDYNFESMAVPRASITKVYDFIVADLEFAEEHLPLHDFQGDNGYGRATSLAASGLLSKVWLTRGGFPLNEGMTSYVKAKDYAQKVMDSNQFQLLDDYGTVFTSDNKNNREILFSVQFGSGLNDQGNWGGHHNAASSDNTSKYGFIYQPEYGDGYGRSKPTSEMIDAWEPTDPRRIYNTITTMKKGAPDVKYKWLMRKFRFKEAIDSKNQTLVNAVVLRYADVLLMAAEAENEINGPTELAYSLINLVRERARRGIPSDNETDNPASLEPADLAFGLDFADQDAFRSNMFWERARELSWEGNDRFDLVRSGKYLEYTEDAEHLESNGYEAPREAHTLLPLPIVAMRNNPALEGSQNPGY